MAMTESLVDEIRRHILNIQEYGSDADLEAFGAAMFRRGTELLADINKGWESIESAPKDGTNVDLWCAAPAISPPARIPDCWNAYGEWRSYDASGDVQAIHPDYLTHWRPIPAHPVKLIAPAPGQSEAIKLDKGG